MAQKPRLLVPAIALLLSLIPLTSAEAAVTAGASCKTSGQIVIVKGAQFKCVKKGKKLIWSKFKERTQSAPTPTPSASSAPIPSTSPSPTPSATPSPTATPSLTQVSKPSDSPSTSPSPTANPLKRPDIPSQALVVQALLDEVWKRDMKSKTKYRVVIEPARANSVWAKEQSELIDLSLEFLAKLGFDIKTESTIYIGWGFNWLNNYVPRNSWCYNATWSGGGSCGEGILFLNLKHTAEWIRSGDEEVPFPTPVVRFVATSVTTHELAHQAQRDYSESNGKTVSFYPSWIREGSPELLKIAVYAKYYGLTYTEVRDLYLYHGAMFTGCGNAKLMDLLMSDNDERRCNSVGGFLASEYLIATTKNVQSTFTFASSKIAGQGPRFDQERKGISNETYQKTMQEVFDIDINNWHPLVEGYLEKWAP
jgi:hypothetical protein